MCLDARTPHHRIPTCRSTVPRHPPAVYGVRRACWCIPGGKLVLAGHLEAGKAWGQYSEWKRVRVHAAVARGVQ